MRATGANVILWPRTLPFLGRGIDSELLGLSLLPASCPAGLRIEWCAPCARTHRASQPSQPSRLVGLARRVLARAASPAEVAAEAGPPPQAKPDRRRRRCVGRHRRHVSRRPGCVLGDSAPVLLHPHPRPPPAPAVRRAAVAVTVRRSRCVGRRAVTSGGRPVGPCTRSGPAAGSARGQWWALRGCGGRRRAGGCVR